MKGGDSSFSMLKQKFWAGIFEQELDVGVAGSLETTCPEKMSLNVTKLESTDLYYAMAGVSQFLF